MSSTEAKKQNTLYKYSLLIGAFGLATFLGSLWLGWTLTLVLLGVGAIITTYSLHMAPDKILRWQKAQLLNRHYNPELYQLVNRLAINADLKYSPDVYLVRSHVPNAFALGTQSRPVIGITSGLVNLLGERELAGVLAHEISHIRNNDLLVKGLAMSFGNLTHTLSWIGRLLLLFAIPLFLLGFETVSLGIALLLIVSPGLNILLQLGLSRSMEYLADQSAAEITRDPLGLASALQRIESAVKPWWAMNWRPVRSQSGADWLRSHPNTQKRVERLRHMAGINSRQIPIHRRSARPELSEFFRNRSPFDMSLR